MIAFRAVTIFVIATMLFSGTCAPGVDAEGPLDQFTSPYNTAFSVEADVFERDRTPAVSFSNNFAGFRQVDPLVAPGQRRSMHDHAWLGTRLTANTDINRLFDAPMDWDPNSNATERNRGFAGMTTYQGRSDGYTSGVWWPAIWDAPPGRDPVRVTYLDGISAYYVARADHGNQYLEAYPNGLGFLIDQFEFKLRDNGRTFNVNFLGPMYWDGKNLTSPDHRSHLSYTQSASHPVAIPQFQTFVKARLGYPNDPTPLEDRLKFGNPGAWSEPHLDYVAGFRQPWFHQWLLDLGPNWGHPDNPLRDCGVAMPGSLDRRKLEGVRLPTVTPDNGRSICSAGGAVSPRATVPPTAAPTTVAPTTQPPTTEPTTSVIPAGDSTESTQAPATPSASPAEDAASSEQTTTTTTAGASDASVTQSTVASTEESESADSVTGDQQAEEETLEVVVDDEADEPAGSAGESDPELEPHDFCPIVESEDSSVRQIAAARLEPGLVLEPLDAGQASGVGADADTDLESMVPTSPVALTLSLLGALAMFGTYKRSRRRTLL